MRDGFIKVAAISPEIRVADCDYNAQITIEFIKEASEHGVQVALFPELGLTGATCGDLFLQSTLQNAALEALMEIAEATEGLDILVSVGLPAAVGGKLYNTAAIIQDGELLGLVPKGQASGVFAAGPEAARDIRFGDSDCPFGQDIVFFCAELPSFSIALEIGEDRDLLLPPSAFHSAAGAAIILNPTADFDIAGSARSKREIVSAHSKRLCAGYVLSAAGPGESTGEGVCSGHSIIAENGEILSEARPFSGDIAVSEIDVELIAGARLLKDGFGNREMGHIQVYFSLVPAKTELTREISRLPFVPEGRGAMEARCREVLEIQAEGLLKRMEHSAAKTAVVGVSGGLDSTLALLAVSRCFEKMGRSPRDIIAITMPCFGTTERTRTNAAKLCMQLGVSVREVDISEAVMLHFRDIGHDPSEKNAVYENAQARERTQVLMDMANKTSGLVVGTGDLSELALGWATYNGDHMSMYNVNCSIPKTLARAMIWSIADTAVSALAEVLRDILDTPVSPELLPANGGGFPQRTEDILGPYELHDFFLFNMIKLGFSPEKTFRLANLAFRGNFRPEEILRTLETFVRRFFSQQFKRSCSADGPQATEISLSPRSGHKMPSDACASIWLEEIERLKATI